MTTVVTLNFSKATNASAILCTLSAAECTVIGLTNPVFQGKSFAFSSALYTHQTLPLLTSIAHVVYVSNMRKRRTNIYLTEEQLRKLEVRKQKTGVPIAEQIRRAIEKDLKGK